MLFGNGRSGSDDGFDASLYDFSRNRISGLLSNGDFIALGNEPRNVFFHAMIRDSRHRNRIFRIFIFGSNDEI